MDNKTKLLNKETIDNMFDNEKIIKFLKWCESEYGITSSEDEDIFDMFYNFSKDAKCHYETLITSYIIMINDMKSVMEYRLKSLNSDSIEKIEESTHLLNNWNEKMKANKTFVEKELIAAKEMLTIIQNFIDFSDKCK